MITRKVTVAASGGLHARTAGMFAQAAGRQPVLVMVRSGDRKPVQARSLLAVLSLGATCGAELTLEADGDGAAEGGSAARAACAGDVATEAVADSVVGAVAAGAVAGEAVAAGALAAGRARPRLLVTSR